MNIRLRQLRAFKAIVETGSASDAAKALGLTQSSVSKTLAGLEAELGFLLFERIGRRLHLSEQGRMFYEQSGSAIDVLAEIETSARDIRENQGKRIRVAAIGPMLYSRLLPDALAQFSASHPEFNFTIDQKMRIEMDDWVSNRNSDIGFTLLPTDRNRLSSQSFSRVRAVAIVPGLHPLADRPWLGPRDFDGSDIVMPRSTVRLRGLVEACFVQAGIPLSPRFETSNSVSTVHLVARGLGIAVVDPFTLTGFDHPDIRQIEWRPAITLDYGLIWPRSRSLTTHEEQLLQCARDTMPSLRRRYPAFPECDPA